jgi:hypothetical protein
VKKEDIEGETKNYSISLQVIQRENIEEKGSGIEPHTFTSKHAIHIVSYTDKQNHRGG